LLGDVEAMFAIIGASLGDIEAMFEIIEALLDPVKALFDNIVKALLGDVEVLFGSDTDVVACRLTSFITSRIDT
jgi:hypothetical protein